MRTSRWLSGGGSAKSGQCLHTAEGSCEIRKSDRRLLVALLSPFQISETSSRLELVDHRRQEIVSTFVRPSKVAKLNWIARFSFFASLLNAANYRCITASIASGFSMGKQKSIVNEVSWFCFNFPLPFHWALGHWRLFCYPLLIILPF